MGFTVVYNGLPTLQILLLVVYTCVSKCMFVCVNEMPEEAGKRHWLPLSYRQL